ncbi:BRCA1-associated RING domain protein 1-like [Frankliniella occidentalis]|uniref:BRCA1-associated RING domain protein 1-like n=1 Tax=Frankliniella occidentalis TaxID=133901 RepID=A0A6J1T574_FRAOC|nr:BRCA1-associated RING domain protein 1-like [Frankliniella occidentalis]
MASNTSGIEKWKNVKAAMVDLQDLLRCWTCNKIFLEPVSYRCGHFFCADCAKESGTKCGTCNVPSLASEIRSDRIVTAVVGCFQKLSQIINSEECSDKTISNTTTNEKKASRSTLYDYDTHEDSNISPSKKDTSKVPDDSKGNLRENESTNVTKDIPQKRPRKMSEKLKEAMADLGVNEENFLKPSSVKKQPVKETKKKVGARKKSLSTSIPTTSNQSVDLSGSINLEETMLKNTSNPSSSEPIKDLTGKKTTSNEEFLKDSFITPKKPRRSTKSSSTIASTPKSTEVKYTPRKSNTPGRELSKKNHKGETPLHVACIKGNVDRIRTLLSANASPNTKDNAGWTPLHEAAIRGFTEVVELLLKAGALIDVPGTGNVTPLHEAVIYNHIAIVKSLVAHGADIHARSSDGKTPIDLATSSEIKEVLLNTEPKDQLSKSDSSHQQNNLAQQEMVLCGEASLTAEERNELCALAVTLDARLVPVFGPDVTHFIVPSNANCTCPPSLEVLCAILKGVLILTSDWISVCKDGDIGVDIDLFELAGITDFRDSEAPKKSRINAQKQLPRLFDGCHFYLTSNVQYKLQTCLLTRSDIMTLVKSGGGIVLTRQPDPEAIPAKEQTVPYHAPRDGPLTATSHIILYSPGKGEPDMKYNMKHCKTLPMEWFIHSVVNWCLLDP